MMVSRYCTCRRGGWVGAASFSVGLGAFAFCSLATFAAGLASADGGLPPAGLAALSCFASFPFASFSLFSLAMI